MLLLLILGVYPGVSLSPHSAPECAPGDRTVVGGSSARPYIGREHVGVRSQAVVDVAPRGRAFGGENICR